MSLTDDDILAIAEREMANTASPIESFTIRFGRALLAVQHEQMARALPVTEQEIIDFIGSNFDVHQHSSTDGTPLDLADQRFTLSVHDLLSAFWHWRLSGGTLGSEACG